MSDQETRNNDNWGAEAWRKPSLPDDAKELISEHGRIIKHDGANYGVDYRSHWLIAYEAQFGGYFIRVKHGAGEQTFGLSYVGEHLLKAIAAIPDSNDRYEALYGVYSAASNAAKAAAQETAAYYQNAFVQGRMKKRKRNNRIYVQVLPQITTAKEEA